MVLIPLPISIRSQDIDVPFTFIDSPPPPQPRAPLTENKPLYVQSHQVDDEYLSLKSKQRYESLRSKIEERFPFVDCKTDYFTTGR